MEKLTPEQERERASWQYRTVAATRGNQTLTGCILLAVLGKAASNPPQAGPTAIITADGYVVGGFIDRTGRQLTAFTYGPVAGIVNAFRHLADDLKLDDRERTELFDEVRRWIEKDYRPGVQNLEYDHD